MGKEGREYSLADDIISNIDDILAGDFVIHAPKSSETRRIRRSLGMSQSEFAEAYGFPLRTLQDWEQGRREPDTSVLSYLKVIEKMPKQVREALKKSA